MNKKHLIILLMAFCLSLSSCVSTRDTVRVNKVEPGMSKEEIQNLLGTPLFKNANEAGEEWGYRKFLGEISRQDVVIFTATFNTNGKVIANNSVKDYPYYRH